MSESHNPQDAAHSLPHRLQAYEKQRGARREEQKELQRAAAQDQVRGFLEKEAAIVSRPLNPFTTKASSGPGPGEEKHTCRGVGVPRGRGPPWVWHANPRAPHRRCPTRAKRRPHRQGRGQGTAQLLDPVTHARGQGHQAGEAGEPPQHAPLHPLRHRARGPASTRAQPWVLTLLPPTAQSRTVTCPMSGKPLRMSDLTPVRFTPLDGSVDRVGLITRSERYVCAVTRDSLSNATPCAVLRPS